MIGLNDEASLALPDLTDSLAARLGTGAWLLQSKWSALLETEIDSVKSLESDSSGFLCMLLCLKSEFFVSYLVGSFN